MKLLILSALLCYFASYAYARSYYSRDVDCKVSSYGSWSSCYRYGDKLVRKRTRYITVHPKGNGRPCPSLVQYERCEEKKCIVSRWSQWSDCEHVYNGRYYVYQRVRTRKVLRPGRKCPPLEQTEDCDPIRPPIPTTTKEMSDTRTTTPATTTRKSNKKRCRRINKRGEYSSASGSSCSDSDDSDSDSGSDSDSDSGKSGRGSGSDSDSGKSGRGSGSDSDSGKSRKGSGSDSDSGKSRRGSGSDSDSGKSRRGSGSDSDSGKSRRGSDSNSGSGSNSGSDSDSKRHYYKYRW